MLKVIRVKQPEDKQLLLTEVDPETTTWVVADLQSKLELQKRLLEKRQWIADEAVLRASDLWRRLHRRLEPTWQIISQDLMELLAREWLAKKDIPWARAAGSGKQLVQYIEQFLPVLAAEGGTTLMAEWLTDEPEALLRWGRWYYVASEFFLEAKAMRKAPPRWLPAFLLQQEDLPSRLSQPIWARDLIIDLGAALTATEADLVCVLAEVRSITVLWPEPREKEGGAIALWPYELLAESHAAQVRQVPVAPGAGERPRQYRRLGTQLAEVKDATATVRQWLEAGVPPQEIALVAPDIKKYWGSLGLHLEQEGIPSRSERVTMLSTLPAFQSWLADLRVQLGQFNKYDLELSAFAGEGVGAAATPAIPFEEFRRLFNVLYGADDLKRSAIFTDRQKPPFTPAQKVSGTRFWEWALLRFTQSVGRKNGFLVGPMARFIGRLLEESSGIELTGGHWLMFLEQACAREEVPATTGASGAAVPGGISCVNLRSAEWLAVTHVYVMGLTQEALRSTAGSGLMHREVLKLGRDLGFHLPRPDRNEMEHEVEWFLRRSFSEVVLSVPVADFAGNVRAPSLLWLSGAGVGPHETQLPSETRWDQMQRAGFSQLVLERRWEPGQAEALAGALAIDAGQQPLPALPPYRGRLSASQLERYEQCPFLVAAERLFHLTDSPDVDLDLDHRTRGKFEHALLARLSEEPTLVDASDERLLAVLDEVQEASPITLVDAAVWPVIRNQSLKLARRFLNFEKEWQSRFPENRILGREVKAKGYWDRAAGRLCAIEPSQTPSADPPGPEFIGFIDRIDGDGQGRYVVIDYKNSDTGFTGYSHWVANHHYQLPLYAQALELGLTSLPVGRTVAAFFHSLRTMERKKGFRLAGDESGLFELENHHSTVSQEELRQLFDATNRSVQAIVERMAAGEFAPRPEDPSICESCRWRGLCRAPHLNR